MRYCATALGKRLIGIGFWQCGTIGAECSPRSGVMVADLHGEVEVRSTGRQHVQLIQAETKRRWRDWDEVLLAANPCRGDFNSQSAYGHCEREHDEPRCQNETGGLGLPSAIQNERQCARGDPVDDAAARSRRRSGRGSVRGRSRRARDQPIIGVDLGGSRDPGLPRVPSGRRGRIESMGGSAWCSVVWPTRSARTR